MQRDLNIDEDNRYLHMRWKWSKLSGIFLGVFALIWLAMMATFFFRSGFFLVTSLALLPLTLFGLFMLYGALAQIYNHTDIYVNDEFLKVSTTPFGFGFSNKNIAVSDIKQVYVRRIVTKTKNQGVQTSYSLNLLMHTGKKITLLRPGSLEVDQLLELEEKIEKFLEIPDHPVENEVLEKRYVKNLPIEIMHERNDQGLFEPQFVEALHRQLYFSKGGEFIYYLNHEYKMLDNQKLIIDDQRRVDRLIRVCDEFEDELFFYLKQEGNYLDIFREAELHPSEYFSISNDLRAHKPIVEIKDSKYFLKENNLLNDKTTHMLVYVGENENEILRIEINPFKLDVHRGFKVSKNQFSHVLNLQELGKQREKLEHNIKRENKK